MPNNVGSPLILDGYNGGLDLKFRDTFDRTDGTVDNNWTLRTDSNVGNLNSPFAISSNTLYVKSGHSGNDGLYALQTYLYRTAEGYSSSNIYEIKTKIKVNGNFGKYSATVDHYFLIGGSGSTGVSSVGSGMYVKAISDWQSASVISIQGVANGAVGGTAISLTFNEDYYIKVRIEPNLIRYKAWLTTASEPGWTQSYAVASSSVGNELVVAYKSSISESNPVYQETWIDNLEVFCES